MAQMDVLHMHFISLYFHIINNNYNVIELSQYIFLFIYLFIFLFIIIFKNFGFMLFPTTNDV
jgi:hypothetical protein